MRPTLMITVAVIHACLPALAATETKAPPAPAAGTQAEPSPDPDDVDTKTSPVGPGVVTSGPSKRQACREDARHKRLRGMDALDSVQLCMAEARLACVKEAIAKKVGRAKRRDFIRDCVN